MRGLRALWTVWKKFAHGLGVVNRYVLLTLFYFLLVNVVNIFLRLFRIDLLDKRMRPATTYWRARATAQHKLYEHQF